MGYSNEDRTRYYGLRVGDIVEACTPGGNRLKAEVIRLGGSLADNNRVHLSLETGQEITYVAEWCEILTKVEDRNG